MPANVSSSVGLSRPSAFPLLPAWHPELFASPTAIFRGAPFWSWNGRLERGRLVKQFETFDAMGIGGGHIHSRTGLADEYLGTEFMAHVAALTDLAQRKEMLVWLYDEDRWPSGFAGGLVTRDSALRCRHLLLTRKRPLPGEVRHHPIHHGPPQPVTQRTFVAAWALRFEGQTLATWRRIDENDDVESGEVALYAYIEIAPDWSWFNHQQYANLLDPKAIARFIEVTHDRFAQTVGAHFGKTIPAIFTDEPLFRGMDRPESTDDTRDLRIAWVDDLPQTYQQQFGEDLLDRLPSVLFDAADGSSFESRWRFRDHHTQRFVEAFAMQLGYWCGKHHIALTGHMMCEESLGLQSTWVGEVMRSLRYFQLPGIDMLCDRVEYTTAKQAQSVSRQCDRPGVLSELYGVTNWDFPFSGHLRQGNWQAALGVTVRVHHLSWYSMAGEAKRDYPASIGWHSPWWREYPAVEDHFARVAVALQTGKPVCRVAMLHPIESYWVSEGPSAAYAETQTMLEEGFSNTLTWLLEGQIDADLIAESLLPELCPVAKADRLRVGAMSYEAVVLPPLLTIRSSTLARLVAFVAGGGVVISLGPPPELVDGRRSDAAIQAATKWRRCEANRTALMRAIAPWRDVEVLSGNRRAGGVIYQLRQEEGGRRILFVCRTDKNHDLSRAKLVIKDHWQTETLNTADGTSCHLGETWTSDGSTHLNVDLPVGGHVLLRLARADSATMPKRAASWRKITRLEDPVPFTLDEPNVLLLDRPAWRLDGGAWQPEEEILRADNLARAAAGLPGRHGDIAQPWADAAAPPTHRVTVRYSVDCAVAVRQPKLALERADQASIQLDGRPVQSAPDGFYVDEDIATVPLPDLDPGLHHIEVTWPFGLAHALEACYLLGSFGVALRGQHAQIIALPKELAFGDWCGQGLPFYGGNTTYHCRVNGHALACAVRVPRFATPLLAVASAGNRLGRILLPSQRIALPTTGGDGLRLDITAFGDRINTFGPLHNCNPHEKWWGPPSWRSGGDNWTMAYQVRPKGILTAPILEERAD